MLQRSQFACAGLNFGYFYDRSPIIAYDGVPPPAYTMDEYTPSTTPGCRVPHVWLSEGVSLYDRLGQGYTLLRLDAKVDVSALVDEANLTGVPLSIIDIPPGVARKVRDLYGEALVLVRPDRHVAWRGDALPLDAKGLIDVVRGASSAVPDGAGRAETATGGVS